MRKIALSVVGFLALAAVIGFVATSDLGSSFTASPASGSAGGGTAHPAVDGAIGATGALPVVNAAGASASPAPAVGAEKASGVGSVGLDGSLGNLGLTQIGPSIVKTAEISMLVKAGGFNSAFQSATMIAARYGGYVESSSSAGVKHRSGDLLIRVPSDRFDQAMSDLRRLGQVESQSLSGQDVTSQFVDLEARLRTWEAQEAALIKLMGRANSVEATLRIQRELQDVQFRIEEIKGQLRVLQNQTDLATIQVHLREPGTAFEIRQRPVGEERPSLVEAWGKAIDGFLGVLYATVVGLGYLVPVTVLVLLVVLGYRRLRPSVTRATQG
jgi:Domain of unknown function (DUF4349)